MVHSLFLLTKKKENIKRKVILITFYHDYDLLLICYLFSYLLFFSPPFPKKGKGKKDKEVVEMKVKEELAMCVVVAELMIMANRAVASFIASRFCWCWCWCCCWFLIIHPHNYFYYYQGPQESCSSYPSPPPTRVFRRNCSISRIKGAFVCMCVRVCIKGKIILKLFFSPPIPSSPSLGLYLRDRNKQKSSQFLGFYK